MTNNIDAINANPEEVYKFLADSTYRIPDYQRPYSWGKDECVKLWEDLVDYFEEKNGNENYPPYFLGNVVIYGDADSKRCVVDGQQRLITLSILMRVLWEHCKSYANLQKTLYERDRKDDSIKQPLQLRIEHNVLGEKEEESLKTVLIRASDCIQNSRYEDNYLSINEKVTEYFIQKNNSQITEQIIDTILYKVVLLPIKCTDFDSALTIFETINNRGMDLSDADIIKSKLYKVSKEEKDDFIIRWNELLDDAQMNGLDLQQVFYQYMHVIRGTDRNIDNVIGLRKYFSKTGRLVDWKDTLDSVEKLVWGWSYLSVSTDEKNNSKFNATSYIFNWFKLLLAYPNDYWQYPIMVFMHKYVVKNELGQFYLPESQIKPLEELLTETARYCYAKWLKHRGVTAIKFTIFKVVRDIIHGGDYKTIFSEDLANDSIDSNQLRNILSKKFSSLNRGRKGICFLSSLLKNQQRTISDDIQIEHILPEKYERYRYDDWDESKFTHHFDTLGNVVILERRLNIKASNQFFIDKTMYYLQSDIADVRDLASNKNWTPKLCQERHKEITNKLIDFFEG
jgi:uncharacterized protein with ParB-like and HNH nuclease domain